MESVTKYERDKLKVGAFQNRSIVLVMISWIIFHHSCMAQFNRGNDLANWPKGSSPEEVGEKVVQRFLVTPHATYNAPNTRPHIPYFEVCTWYGALTFAKEAHDKKLTEKLASRFEPLFSSEAALLPVPDHVDYTVFGAVPLELYLQTGEQRYLDMAKHYANAQWGPPEGPRVNDESREYYKRGLTWQTRLWIDDMYMITAVQAQAFRVTGDRKYIDHAAVEMSFYLDTLQRPNGLFYHGPNAPLFWGRGNGWMAAAMTELLRALPDDNEHYPRILESYRKMMATLLSYQSENGMWRQLIDDPEAWPETSCTGMFTFAMITGLKNGWLDETIYRTAARKGWLALISYLNKDAELQEVCEGTGQSTDRQYYLNRKRATGDFHGQAAVLWCASALLRTGK